MKILSIVTISSLFLFGCNPSSQNSKCIKKIEVSSVTIVDPTIPTGVSGSTNTKGGLSEERESPYKTYYKTDFSHIYIESDEEWLRITRVFKKSGVKETTVDYYKPDSVIKFTTKD